jgi:hypothetical protein
MGFAQSKNVTLLSSFAGAFLAREAVRIKLLVEVHMRYHLTSVVLILAAIILEVIGFGTIASAFGVILLGTGVALELWFWIRLVRVRAHLRLARGR